MFRFKNMYVFLRKAPVADGPPADTVLELAKGGAGQFAIIVDDVDAVTAELAERGVPVISGPSDRDWGMRTVTFADPSGHVWEIAQEVPGLGARAVSGSRGCRSTSAAPRDLAGLAAHGGPDPDFGQVRRRPVPAPSAGRSVIVMHCSWVTTPSLAGPRKSGPGEPA